MLTLPLYSKIGIIERKVMGKRATGARKVRFPWAERTSSHFNLTGEGWMAWVNSLVFLRIKRLSGEESAEGGFMTDMISLERARALVLESMKRMPVETVGLLEAVGRVVARDLTSDIDVSPFDHAAMDGFAVKVEDLAQASSEAPVALKVVGELGAGDVLEGSFQNGECVRIMTGAAVPDDADAVIMYEIVEVLEGDGKTGSVVAFSSPAKLLENIRKAGEEAHAGDVVITEGEVLTRAGVGFLAGCGVLEVPVYARPRVAIMATGSELVPPEEVPGPGKIRNSNALAMAACTQAAGAVPVILPIVKDTFEALRTAVREAAQNYDFVVTTGGAAQGDYDFITAVVDDLGELRMTTVAMRPGKAQTFGIIEGVPVFGLPGNPAAAYVGFEMLIRPALRAMQGYQCFEHSVVKARLTVDQKNNSPRRIFQRAHLTRGIDGAYLVTPYKNQSSGLFGPIQKSNCLMILPEKSGVHPEGSLLDCVLLDVPEEVCL
jgi:molybdopterin molybdotransferase